MGTLFIDPVEYMNRYLLLEEAKTEVKMGHIHLKVGDIEEAKQFYVEILGFDVTAELPGALFVSVGGYHHHIGMNSWESAGASQRKTSLGLKNFEVVLSDLNSFNELKSKLREHKITFVENGQAIHFDDPWKNHITVFS